MPEIPTTFPQYDCEEERKEQWEAFLNLCKMFNISPVPGWEKAHDKIDVNCLILFYQLYINPIINEQPRTTHDKTTKKTTVG